MENEYAWAAGLFEGEGCLTWMHEGTYPGAILSMTDEDVVRRFAAIIGIGKVRTTQFLPQDERNGGGEPTG